MNVAQALSRSLAAHGVEHVFTLMGGGNLRMIHHLVDDDGVAVHHVRHEAAAVGAADGYARATGRVGVCTVTHGPGFTNTLTALVTAQRGRTPLLLITTDSSHIPGERGPFATVQAFRPELVLEPLGLPVIRTDGRTVVADLRNALRTARERRLPVTLIVAAGGGDSEVVTDPTDAEPAEITVRHAAAPDPAVVAEAVRRLLEAERPVLLAGRGVVATDSAAALRQLAHRVDATLVTSLRAAGLFAGDPRDRGIAGGFSSDSTADLIRNADCVMAFGASLNWFTTRRGELLAGTAILHCDSDPDAIGRYLPADLGVVGDVRTVLDAMLAALDEPTAPSAITADPGPDDFQDASTEGAFDPRAICRALDEALPTDRAIITDAGHFSAFPVLYLPVSSPDRLLYMTDFGAVGSSIGAAAGAAIGRLDRPTALFIGDGGLFMTLGELDLLVRDQVPLLVVVMNDQAYGSELVHLQDSGLPEKDALFETPDLAAVARAIGCAAERIESLPQLRSAVERWLGAERPGPLVLDCPITRAVRSPIYAHI